MSSLYERMTQFYTDGDVPWDAELPPPEVIDLVEGMAPGRALDLGCGYGRASIYLAQRGWQVDGVDFVPLAIAEAKTRAQQAGVSPNFYCHSATDLSFLTEPYDLVIDVGCAHGFDEAQLTAYRAELVRLTRPGSHYLLFARLQSPNDETPSGLDEPAFRTLFANHFILTRYEPGATHMPNGSWQSAWFWFECV